MSDFDFNEWATLHTVDPVAFDLKREAVLRQFIDNADEKSRHSLEQTLFRIRMTSLRAKSPLQAAMESSKLMWESFGKLREKLDELNHALHPPVVSNGPNSLRLIGKDGMAEDGYISIVAIGVNKPEEPLHQARVLPFKASGKPSH